MTVKRPMILAPFVLALLAACGSEPSGGDGRAASGEVLEGTISDAMLPVDRVRSEAPLEDPEAFAKARSAADGAEGPDDAAVGAGGEEPEAEDAEEQAPAAPPEPAED
jgi:hypothetical protein